MLIAEVYDLQIGRGKICNVYVM